MLIYANEYKRNTSFKVFLMYCQQQVKNKKENEYRQEYNSNRFYDLVTLLSGMVQAKTDLKPWTEVKTLLSSKHHLDTRTDTEVEEDIIKQYNEIYNIRTEEN